MKDIVVLGSTGSIGTQTLDVIRQNKEEFRASVLTCGKNIERMKEQIKEFNPDLVVTAEEDGAKEIKKEFPNQEVMFGEEGLIAAATSNCHEVLNALMGMRGLVPTYHAIKAGRDIALANKETLVAGGELVMGLIKEKGVKLLPVDSEHSAIFQCLEGNRNKKINRIILTASGGPFRGYNLEQLRNVTLAQALRHPKWNMGQKITIDSATLMNKGLEVIEAKWLFDVDFDKIDVHVHPESIVHSAVEFADTSILAQLGVPDMRIPISVALAYPERLELNIEPLDLFKAGKLTFEKPDPSVFKCFKLAVESGKAGGSYPVVMNGANEVLVDRFLKGKINFIDIQEELEKILEKHKPSYNLSLEEIIEIDKRTREEI